MKTNFFLLAIALLLAPAFAADRPFENGAPVTLRADQGYVLVRSFKAKRGLYTVAFSPVLIRVLSQEEIEKAEANESKHTRSEPNVVIPTTDHPYSVNKNEVFVLMPLKPGTYVLGGLVNINWNLDMLVSSLCMGTVKFEVKPGVVTDLGTILNARHDQPTDIPELANVVAGKDVGMQVVLEDVAVRPLGPDTETPDALKSLPIVPADYYAVGWFPNYLGAQFGRLAPLPGVLDYDKDGQVIDLKAVKQ